MADQKTILVVDDDRELIDGLRAVLEQQGYKVIQAHDGHQAKPVIYNQRPDLVILDMMMPRMGGYPVLEHFRGKPDAPPIIMITANEGSRHKAYAEYLGRRRLHPQAVRDGAAAGGGEQGVRPDGAGRGGRGVRRRRRHAE